MGNEKNAGNKKGNRLDYRQETMDGLLDRAKAECGLSNRLYNLLIDYQERFQTKQEPYKAEEKIGQLNLPLSRLYSQLWDLLLEAPAGDRARKQVEEQYKKRGKKAA